MAWQDPLKDTDLFLRQLIVGRYRNWGSFNWDHFIIFLSVIGGTVYIYMIILNFVAKRYTEELDAIPVTELPITTKDLSRGLYNTIQGEVIRVQDITNNRRIRPEMNVPIPIPTSNFALHSPSSPDASGVEWLTVGDATWHASDPVTGDAMHYATTISKSWAVLERNALSRRPGLHRKEARSVREYISTLRRAFPGLRKDLCDEYIGAYERAVFGDNEITFVEYSRFVEVVLTMVGVLNDRSIQLVKGSAVGALRTRGTRNMYATNDIS